MAPEVGFGAVFPYIWPQLSSLHLSNQADSLNYSRGLFHCCLLAILLAQTPRLVAECTASQWLHLILGKRAGRKPSTWFTT
jgi:hypothetical protein